ncbi:MAG: DNA translocase FtsK 4TM domain-containing protein, partial [Bacteroidota bacterium]|nr:DNA translocase FtsK 4TM domain-containing protein [Bacteroidota bacterium]
MANRLKKKTPDEPKPEELAADKETEVTLKEVARDDRTRKMMGAVSLLLCLFLFIAFTSYLFTWQEDGDKVQQLGIKIFSISDVQVANLLGVMGAYVAHYCIDFGFGLASYFLCSFFFIAGVNLLFEKKVFSLVRNVKYVLVGSVVVSITLSFFTNGAGFSYGGAVGELVEQWLVKWVGKTGTGALLSFALFTYVIWRFNPTFHLPERKKKPIFNDDELFALLAENEAKPNAVQPVVPSPEKDIDSHNTLKGNSKSITVMMPKQALVEDDLHLFVLTEKDGENKKEIFDEEDPFSTDDKSSEAFASTDFYNKEPEFVVNDLYAKEANFNVDDLPTFHQPIAKGTITKNEAKTNAVKIPSLEIKEVLDNETAEEAVAALSVKTNPLFTKGDYDPMLDLKDYKMPTLDLLETHGSEKIVHDAEELEANKTQIIETLKNYDISIQKIAATVGPTVTLYEIVPAPGVRISRIKNLEDDIALSLAALGIRIIAPIPGKGTIGIEVPNVRKTVVSMKTLLASEKFQNNNFSLPIAIG